MSKDSLNTGGSRLTLEDLMRINPDLANVGAGTAPPAATEEPAMIRTTTPEAIESFYGSGDRIVQPDQSYYQDFALPGVQMERPNPDAPVTSDPGATQPADTSSPGSGIPIFDAGVGGESGAYIPSNGYVPDGLAEAYEIANRQSASQRRRRSAQDMIAAYQANRRSMPIEAGTGNQGFGGLFRGETTGNAKQRTRDEMQAAQDARAAASMPILDMADGRYEPDMRAYMNFQGGMR